MKRAWALLGTLFGIVIICGIGGKCVVCQESCRVDRIPDKRQSALNGCNLGSPQWGQHGKSATPLLPLDTTGVAGESLALALV